MDEKEIGKLAAEEQKAYQREWRARNKAKVRKYNKSYWERKALKRLESQYNKQEVTAELTCIGVKASEIKQEKGRN